MLRSLPTGEERRDLSLVDAGVNVKADTGAQRFIGHAAMFDRRTTIGNPLKGGFYEQVAPGAFTKTIDEADARFLIDHSSYHVVSRASAGTLNLSQDGLGLLTNSTLDTRLSYVNDLIANLDNGNIRGMSFGFQVVKDDWTSEEGRGADGQPAEVELRTIREVKLIEVSAVTFPAYEETDAGLRYSLVPALRHRGDPDAIARACSFRPELAPLLDYDPQRRPVHIDLALKESLERIKHEIEGLPGEVLGHDTPITAEGSAMEPFEERDPKKPYGDVSYADPGYKSDGKKRYPINTKEHAKAAWSYINQAGNASGYSAEQLKAIKGRIKAACKKFGIEISDESKSADEPAETTQQQARVEDETPEPAASTRNAPSRHELAKAELKRLRALLRAAA